MEKVHKGNINDSYKSLNAKWPENIQRLTNNPLIYCSHKNVRFSPYANGPFVQVGPKQ